MRQVKVWRYYCDFCKKGGCGKAAMAKHEKRCVKNPHRECGMCAICGDAAAPVGELIIQDRQGDAYVIGDASWNKNGRPFELIEGRMARDVPSHIQCKGRGE